MSRYSDHDKYVDPASGVLRNRFGIADAVTLERTEADLVASRSREIAINPIPGRFDLAHLKAIHRYLFGDLYDWAGELRRVDISKNGHMFAHHTHIMNAATEIFDKLARERHLRSLDLDAFIERGAYYLSEINALHPFREGNGRTQREFISHLAMANGYYADWDRISLVEMLQASIRSFNGDLVGLMAVLGLVISKSPS